MMLLCKRIGFVVLVALLLVSSSADAAGVLTIMPLGDSNTRGTEVGGTAGPHPAVLGAGGYRYPLQQMLTDGGYCFDFVGSQTSNGVGEQGDNPPSTWAYDPAFDPDHQGLAGFTSAKLITGGPVPTNPGEPVIDAPPLVTCLSTYQPNIVLLMSGTNSIHRSTVSANLTSLNSVIQTITTNSPTTRVIVSTIFDRWSGNGVHDPAYATLDAETETYNAGIPGLVAAAQQNGNLVTFVDTGSALTLDDFCYNGVLDDGVHPNPLALGKVAEVWYAGIQAAQAIVRWDGGGAPSTNVSNPVNWESDTLPDLTSGTSVLDFNGVGATAVDTTVNIRGISFTRAGTFSIYSGTLSIGSDGITATRSGTDTHVRTYDINSAITMTAAQTWSTGNLYSRLLIGATGSVDNGGFKLTLRPYSGSSSYMTLRGVISGSGGLEFTGDSPSRVLVESANTYTGNTTVSSSCIVSLRNVNAVQNSTVDLQVNNSVMLFENSGTVWTFGGLAGIGNLSLTNWNPVAIDLRVGNNGDNTSYSGILSGIGGSLTKIGIGTLTLTGANTYSGATTVKAGTMAMNSTAYTAVITAGSSAGLDLQSGTVVFDHTGDATLVSNVQGLLDTGYHAGWLTGQIRNTTSVATGLTLGWKDDALTHQMTVMATYPGDANMDGAVDVTDLNTVLSYYNTPNVWNHGDFNYDGNVDVTDLNTVLSYYNQTIPSGMSIGRESLVGVSIPEPNTLALSATGLLGLLAYAWRKQKQLMWKE